MANREVTPPVCRRYVPLAVNDSARAALIEAGTGSAVDLCQIGHMMPSIMKAAKARRLKAAGWKIGSTKDFLRLNDQESALVEVKLCLMDALRQARRKRGISQIDLAKRMGSSQSRIAKIEAGDPSVSLDLILRALVASGASRREIQETLAAGYPG